LGEEIAKRESLRLRETGRVVLLGAASERHAHAAPQVAHAIFGEGEENGVEGGLLHVGVLDSGLVVVANDVATVDQGLELRDQGLGKPGLSEQCSGFNVSRLAAIGEVGRAD